MKKLDFFMATVHSLLPAGGLAFSYFIMGWGWAGCILLTLLSFFAASLILATYIWWQQRQQSQSQKRREK